MIRAAIILGAFLLLAASAAPAAHAQTCVGDCNHDNMVLINELIIGVNIALDLASIDTCPEFDVNGDGMVKVNELITAVNNALVGCGPPPGVDRVFTIADGILGAPADQTRSGLFTGELANTNVAKSISQGPLTIVMGVRDASGKASLRLKEDVVMSIQVITDQCLCIRYLAENSDGSIDCGLGTTPYDTQATRAANAPTLAWESTAGLGTPSGVPGNANLLVQGLFQLQDATCDTVDCATVVFPSPPNLFAFTTTKATAIQGASPAPKMLTDVGEPFDCDHFDQPGKGMLAAPAPTTQVGIDAANIFRFSEAHQ